MAITAEITKPVEYAANGSRVAYPYGERVLDASHLVVTLISAANPNGVSTNDYTVAGIGDDAGVTITTNTVLEAGITVSISEVMPALQEEPFPDATKVPMAIFRDAFDLLTKMVSSIKGSVKAISDRAVQIPLNEVGNGIATEWPAIADRASKVHTWDASGNIQGSTPATGDLANNAINVVYDPAGAGSLATTSEAKHRESVSILDFYANGVSGVRVDKTGIVDSTAGIQAAVATGSDVHIPLGTYLITAPIKVVTSGQVIYGDGWNCVIRTTDATLQFGFAVVTGAIGVHFRNFKMLGAATSSESAPVPNAAIGVNTNAGATGFEMTYPDIQNGRARMTGMWLDNWHTSVANNHSDELYVVGNLFTRQRGLASGYGYGITSSGSRSTVSSNIFDNSLLQSTGAHDGAASAAVLTDTGRDWEVNIFTGKTIHNITDGSTGTVTANTATTITATLSGGTDDDWDVDDVYEVEEAGQGRHAVYLNGHSEDCSVVGNKAYGYGRNPYQFKAQSTTRSGKNHYIAGNYCKDSNRMQNNRGATYMFDTQTPLTAVGGNVRFVDNTAENCRGEQLRFEYNANSEIRNFKAIDSFDHLTQTYNNHPVIMIYSDYTRVFDLEVTEVGASRTGLVLQNCSHVRVVNPHIASSISYRSGIQFNSTSPETNNTLVSDAIIEGTVSSGQVEDATSVNTNTVVDKSGQVLGYTQYTIAAGVVTYDGYSSALTIATESAASTDDLDTINGVPEGKLVYIRAADTGDTVVLKNGTGNIQLDSATDISLDSAEDWISLISFGGTMLQVGAFSNNGI